MPTPLTVHCPACDAALKLKSRQYVGKRVACPKCRKPFVVKDPGDAEDDFSALDDFDSYEDEPDDELDEDYGRPAARKSAPRSAARGKSARSTGSGRRPAGSARAAGKSRKPLRRQRSNLPFIIGGAVVGLGVLVGLGFIVAGMLGKAEVQIQEFSYVPADSEIVGKVRLAEIMNSPWGEQLMNPQQQQALDMISAESGMDFRQIESVTVGVSGLNVAALSGQMGGFGGPMGAMLDPNLKFTLQMQSRTQWPIDKIRKGSRELSHQGETYYVSQSNQVAAYLPNDRTLLIGRETDIKRAIEQGAAPPAMSQFQFADLKQHVGVVFVPRDRSFLQNIQVPDVPGLPAVKKAGDALKTVVGAGFSLNCGADAADVEILARFGSATDASQMKAALDELLAAGKQMLPAFAGAAADPQAAGGMAVANEVLQTLTVNANGDTLSLRVKLSRQAAANLQSLGNLQAGM